MSIDFETNSSKSNINFMGIMKYASNISLEESLSDVEPLNLSKQVLTGIRQIKVEPHKNWRELVAYHV